MWGSDDALVSEAPWEEADEVDSTAMAWCPYCGEPNEIFLDPGGAEQQSYEEDCSVCCNPWQVKVQWSGGAAHVELTTLDGTGY